MKKYKLDKTELGYELSTVEERAISRKIKKFYKKKHTKNLSMFKS